MRFLKKKAIAAAIAAGAVAFGGLAYAYFTTTGAGTGSGAVGTSTALVLNGTVASSLYPGTSSTVSFTVDNASPGHQLLNTIHLVNVTTDSAHSACDVSDFTMPDVVANQDFATGSGQAVTATGTITMANTAVSQDACKNAPLTLHLTSN